MSMSLNLGGLSLGGGFKLEVSRSPKLDEHQLYDLLIIGGGPAALNAGLYAVRKGLSVGIIAKRMGGQLLDTSVVDNYLGITEVSGEGLAEAFKKHLEGSAIPWLEEEVKEVDRTQEGFTLKTGDFKRFQSKTVLLATGSNPRKLGIKGETEFSGKGVAYCAICDGPLYKGKKVIVAGGGNSAVEAAIDLAKVAREVILIHRSQLRADDVLVKELYKLENVSVLLESKLEAVIGNELVTEVSFRTKSGEIEVLKTDGLFVEIGHIPNLGPFENQLEVNDRGEVVIDAHYQTSMKGVFAAGDITPEPYKQIIVAAAEGAKAALSINQFLNTL